jgi:hypothetical protein
MQNVLLKTLTHSPKRKSEMIGITKVKYSRRLNPLYYNDIRC